MWCRGRNHRYCGCGDKIPANGCMTFNARDTHFFPFYLCGIFGDGKLLSTIPVQLPAEYESTMMEIL